MAGADIVQVENNPTKEIHQLRADVMKWSKSLLSEYDGKGLHIAPNIKLGYRLDSSGLQILSSETPPVLMIKLGPDGHVIKAYFPDKYKEGVNFNFPNKNPRSDQIADEKRVLDKVKYLLDCISGPPSTNPSKILTKPESPRVA